MRDPLPVRLYGWMTRLLPGELGARFGQEAGRDFADLHRDAVRERGEPAGWALWARASLQLLWCAARAWREECNARRDEPGAMSTGRGGGGVGAIIEDARYAVRTLVKRSGFALTAIVILAAGIGATTTIFSVVDTVVLRELPYPDAGRLVFFGNGAHPYPNFDAWTRMASFRAVSAARDTEVDLTGEGEPERLAAVGVSTEFFRMFGAAPHLGRLFDPGDFPGDRSVAVLSHAFWTRRFGADPSVVGRAIRIDGAPVVVAGVLGPDFRPPEILTGSVVDVWFPLDAAGDRAEDHGSHVLGVAARLASGVSVEAAQEEVDAERRATAERIPTQYIRRDGSLRTTPLLALREATVGRIRPTLLLLLGAVGLMLLIACANVANLLLAHGTARAREIALRSALGARRSRIASQVLTESVVLALAGGALGVALAYGGVEAFRTLDPGGIPRIDTVEVDLRVLAVTALLSGLTGVVFGLLPALQAMGQDVGDALKEGAATASTSRGGRRVRGALVVTEIALALVLLTGAGLLFRSFVAQLRVDPGFEPEQLVIVPLLLEAEYGEAERLQLADRLLGRIASLPGTRGAAAGWTLPFTYTGGSRCCWRTGITGDPALADEDQPYGSIVHPVTEGYFATLRAPLLYGREFEPADADGTAPVAILNRRAAEDLFGEVDVVGRSISMRTGPLTVVGVVEGVHHWGLSQDVEQAVYVPYAPFGPEFGELEVMVRSETPLETLAPMLRQAVWALDPELPVPEITTMERRMASSVATPRFLSGLLGVFAAVALVLACGGVYGSMLYTVGQRRQEMGIRLALGARGADVIRLVMASGARIATAGIAVGAVAALGLSRFLERLLWGVEPTDAATLAGVALLLGSAALLASFVPAWKAARTDPRGTLRAE